MPSNRQGVSEIPHICLEHGINHAVISSGSRSAPLMLAFASHSRFSCVSITDERSAAYYALGMAQQLQKPVVLICTSGTAVANYAPALAEAYYLKVPLLVLTADRPAEWIDQNDGQTIRQFDIFRKLVMKSYQMPVDTEKENDLWYFRRTMNEAIGYCTLNNPGPVHINIPLNEPLYTPLPKVTETPTALKVVSGNHNLSTESWLQINQSWKSFRNKLIVCGFSSTKNQKLQHTLAQMATNNEAVVIAENLSNLYGEDFIDTPEQFIARLEFKQMDSFQPDLLVTIGGSIISKRLKKSLRQYRPIEHWHVDENELFIDTFQSLNLNIRTTPELFFSKVSGEGVANPSYCELAKNLLKETQIIRNEFIRNAEFSDLRAWTEVFEQLPSNINLHLANSTPVRYAQLFKSRNDISYFSNRGTSGIDGCVSTAAGAAAVTEKLNVLLLGDLAFIYDSNGLWNNNLSTNLRIVVMDNDGGNIFKLIESGPEVDKISPFIVSPHKVKIRDLCSAYGVEYLFADELNSLKNILSDFFKPNERPVVLHIKTSGNDSAQVFKEYFQNIKNSNHE
ncbi:MAG: 2-succinyl-5-enolpyruvyl-6-hydroxy-3-cyclohexene-1-carboxylic-acid synthase [Bacteroidetes bacterium HGW-Bacteroidetes-15]|nr:MAG: 2-succinyl-5-enolpyruvyl-6-hydroxy-3-cyclohexene-1-carboxylic-acid synthase [Bacteroidetes bacterium HGW-Bacteroidetes-15]